VSDQPVSDQPTPPEDPGGGERSSPLRPSVSSATERIQVIIEAAERAAAGIIEDAEAQAHRYLDESRSRADRTIEERNRVMTEITDSLIAQAQVVKKESDDLIAALDQARLALEERVRRDLAALPGPAEAARTEPAPEPIQPSEAEPSLREVPPPEPREVSHLTPVEPQDEISPFRVEGPSSPRADVAGDLPEEPAPEPKPGPPAPSAGARLLATQMAVAGSSRGEIETRLRDEFGVDDAGPMLDSILGPEG
jgi:hypothetical protein